MQHFLLADKNNLNKQRKTAGSETFSARDCFWYACVAGNPGNVLHPHNPKFENDNSDLNLYSRVQV